MKVDLRKKRGKCNENHVIPRPISWSRLLRGCIRINLVIKQYTKPRKEAIAYSIGRTWQCGTIQLDFQLPLRFELEYTGADGEKHRPIMIHRVAFGSIERFIGILIEHFAGAFPTWLAPVQVKALPISDKYLEYGKKVQSELGKAGIRVDIDTRAEKIGYKIREAQMQKIPYMLVVGAKGEENGFVSVRSRFEGDEGQKSLQDFLSSIQVEISQKAVREVKKQE